MCVLPPYCLVKGPQWSARTSCHGRFDGFVDEGGVCGKLLSVFFERSQCVQGSDERDNKASFIELDIFDTCEMAPALSSDFTPAQWKWPSEACICIAKRMTSSLLGVFADLLEVLADKEMTAGDAS